MIVKFDNYKIRTESKNQKEYIYDIVRKKWIINTHEEQVRQVWIHFLIETHKIPISMIAIERGLKINNKLKRFDICVFYKASPWILIECKSPRHKLSESVLQQLTNYNISLNASTFIITNGISHLGMEIINDKMKTLNNFTEIQNLPKS